MIILMVDDLNYQQQQKTNVGKDQEFSIGSKHFIS